ncbi:hypothetical protein [Mycobacterium sp. OTB74]|uniref:hypothetical protein n=1 Tax=Mycobacterium sp. OTB74 TaxID=1853452 RepID=UPI002476BE45|nr:hypothetical protein [Mycobacterium sp. OTB74]MDH6245780.1 hypothetical protein [Mycobacterium sp. OTB74]
MSVPIVGAVRLLFAALLLIGAGLLAAWVHPVTSITKADVANCHSRTVDGVEEDVCVGNPGEPGGVDRPPYWNVVPELNFGVGIGLGM